MAEKNEETPMEDRPEAGPPDQGAGPDAPPSNLNEEVEAAATPEAEETPAAEEAPAAEETAAAEEAPAEEAPAAEETPAAEEAPAAEETPAAEEAPAAEETPKPKASKAGPTRRDKLEGKRAERQAAAGKRKPRTPEERDAERRERRAAVAKQRRAYRQRLKTKQGEVRKAAPAREADQAPEHGPGRAKTRQGIVVSEKGEKTITVQIDLVRRHKRYHKILRSTVKLYAHDERNDAHAGDTVRVQECRPMSRTKRWRLVEVLERAK
jgi:small subunit ribosomal protein S17